MKLGSLFSGAGLGDLGWLMAGMDIRWQCEVDKYCQKILEFRFPESKKYYDIKTLKTEELEPVDIVAGGFPCQPFSVAGKQRGDQDDRNLWPEMLRVIKGVRPTYVVGENVSGIVDIYLDTVLTDLEAEGYTTRTFVFPAHALGANHRRERIWIVSYSDKLGWNCWSDNQRKRYLQINENRESSEIQQEGNKREPRSSSASSTFTDTKRIGWMQEVQRRNKIISSLCTSRQFFQNDISSPRVCGKDDGITNRMDRLKALGNGQVVACTSFIGQQIMEFERLNATT